MQLNITNRVALITGASQGIGRAIALSLANEGVRVAITSNDAKKLIDTKNEIEQVTGKKAFAIEGDASHASDIKKIVSEASHHFGKIDIMINNVGITGRIADFDAINDVEWQELFNLNIMSGVRFSNAVLPFMRNQQWGRIVFLSSERAIEPRTEMPHYSMTKAAILSITKSLANSVGKHGITVNSVAPGVIPTPAFEKDAEKLGLTREQLAAKFCRNVMSPGSLGNANDVAHLVCYLCSETARWITGSNFRVDGGSIASIQI